LPQLCGLGAAIGTPRHSARNTAGSQRPLRALTIRL